jgi:hypothetical protein
MSEEERIAQVKVQGHPIYIYLAVELHAFIHSYLHEMRTNDWALLTTPLSLKVSRMTDL